MDFQIDFQDEKDKEKETKNLQPISDGSFKGSAINKKNNQDTFGSEQDSELKPKDSQPKGIHRLFSLKFYYKFFDVTQADVLQRIILSVIPWKREFIQKIGSNPDFYGPFWLLTTIIFLVSSVGNISNYFARSQKSEYIFKLELIRYSVLIVYSFGFGFPLLAYYTIKFLGCEQLSLPEIICIYGYSFGCFVAVFLLCLIPFDWVHWVLIVYGTLNSIAFLVGNLLDSLLKVGKKKIYVAIGLICLAQFSLFFTFKLVFFPKISA